MRCGLLAVHSGSEERGRWLWVKSPLYTPSAPHWTNRHLLSIIHSFPHSHLPLPQLSLSHTPTATLSGPLRGERRLYTIQYIKTPRVVTPSPSRLNISSPKDMFNPAQSKCHEIHVFHLINCCTLYRTNPFPLTPLHTE